MSYFQPEQVRAAIARSGTIFFDAELNPVQPKAGQWFCEFDIIDTYEGNEIVRDEALVEYLGEEDQHTFGPDSELLTSRVHQVAPEDSDARQPNGWVLILQH